MSNVTYEKFIELVKSYNPDAIPMVEKAYDLANFLHREQKRDSGEPYIIHPLSVAYILAQMDADQNTLCAGLLHDVVEDTEFTKEDIIREFNADVANLVDGVTKFKKVNYTSDYECDLANLRKMILSIQNDVRIVILRLADRLHNMRTLEYKKPHKQVAKARETMEVYVPLSYYIGAYRIKTDLEDLSFQYIDPENYLRFHNELKMIEEKNWEQLVNMKEEISRVLNEYGIKNEIKIRPKSIYGVYKKWESGYSLANIHDLIALKIILEDKMQCYMALGLIHELYNPFFNKFKDYISTPKTNLYQSLHTTVFAPNERLVQIQIRTRKMDLNASYGLISFWKLKRGAAKIIMQEQLINIPFYRTLDDIANMFSYNDNNLFIDKVKEELFNLKNIYVHNIDGEMVELPINATVLDFVFKENPEMEKYPLKVYVNDKLSSFKHVLKSNDIVKIKIDNRFIGPLEDWEPYVTTTGALRRVRELK